MHDAGSAFLADPVDLREPSQQPVHQRLVRATCARVHYETCRLVDDDDVVIGVDDVELDTWIGIEGDDLLSRWQRTTTRWPALTRIDRWVTAVAVDRDVTVAAIMVAAADREQPSSMATTRSSRSPSSGSGSISSIKGVVYHAGSLRTEPHKARSATNHRYIGHVKDGPPLKIDEVDHATSS